MKLVLAEKPYDTYGRHTDIFTVLFRDNSG